MNQQVKSQIVKVEKFVTVKMVKEKIIDFLVKCFPENGN